MMTAIVEQKASLDPRVTRSQVPPSVLLVGKKRTLDYVAPALYRINNTGALVVKATGSLSIVTAVDVAEIIKRDVPDIKTQSITIGTDMLRVSTGELKPMSCIEIHLIKYNPMAIVQPKVDMHVPVKQALAPVIEIPIEEATSRAEEEVPVTVAENAKKPRAKRKSAAKKKTTKNKKKQVAASP